MGYRLPQGDVLDRLRELPSESVQCVVTSPPYWGLRDYGTAKWEGGDVECDHSPRQRSRAALRDKPSQECKCGATRIDAQLGLEKTPAEYIAKMTAVFREVRRVLRSDGTCWVNMGDSYASDPGRNGDGEGYARARVGKDCDPKRGAAAIGQSYRATRPGAGRADGIVDERAQRNRDGVPTTYGLKAKDLCGMPWRLAFALQEDGWWLRQDIIWSKPNPMPESVTDRCTKAHEYIFLLTKSAKYFYDAEAIKENAATDDMPRPYTSQEAWEMDGRPGWKGSRFEDGKNLAVHPNVGKVRTAGNKSHKTVTEYERSDSEEHRTAAGLMKIADTAYAKRNKRSVWEIATEGYAEAHFATFPTKLVEPCIRAGTSEKGCCSACGAPWVRRIEQVDTGMPDGMAVGNYAHGSILAEGRRKGEGGKPVTTAVTLGWRAGCECGAETRACVVLDPFSGSGTTGLVAIAERCEYIGIELNSEYVAMSERRLAAASAQMVLL